MKTPIVPTMKNPVTVEAYFSGIKEMRDSGEKYPVSLNDVFALAYSRKSDALRKLKKEYIEGEDWIKTDEPGTSRGFAQNAQNSNPGGRPSVEYFMTVSTMEHLICRKNRDLFNIYRGIVWDVIDNHPRFTMVQDTEADRLNLAREMMELQKRSFDLIEKVLNGEISPIQTKEE